MVTEQQVRRRTGGRSARVRAAVHQAVADLLGDPGAGQVSVGEVAARSGVHPTSIYRRWGTPEALVLDVAVARLQEESPIPDTGSLRADLLAYARQAAHGVQRPDGLAFLRAVISTDAAAHSDTPGDTHGDGAGAGADDRADCGTPYLAARGAQIQVMLDRATDRGEAELAFADILDGILAPLYLRVLFHVGGIDDPYLTGLVDRLITTGAR